MCDPLDLGRCVAAGGKSALFAAADDFQLLAEMDLDRLPIQNEGLLTDYL